jgi:hypothetical protein
MLLLVPQTRLSIQIWIWSLISNSWVHIGINERTTRLHGGTVDYLPLLCGPSITLKLKLDYRESSPETNVMAFDSFENHLAPDGDEGGDPRHRGQAWCRPDSMSVASHETIMSYEESRRCRSPSISVMSTAGIARIEMRRSQRR